MTDVRPVPHGTHRHLWRGASLALAVLVLAACAQSGPVTPGSTADGPVSPVAAPEGWHKVDRGLVTFSVPVALGDGEEVDPDPRAPDARSFVLFGPTNDHGGRSMVSTSVSEAPTRTASVEANAMENELTATSSIEDMTRTEVTWPGATAATFLTWERDVEHADGAVLRYHHEYLFADLDDDAGQVSVGTVAPVEDYDALQMHEVMTTIILNP